MRHFESLRAVVVVAGLLIAAPAFAQQTPAKSPQGASKNAEKPLFVAKKDTQISWNELRDKYGWNGRPTMPMLETRGQTTTGGWDEKTGLFMTKGRFALDNLEIDGEIGQGPKGVLFKQGTKILGRR
jgi:hypothetical protein